MRIVKPTGRSIRAHKKHISFKNKSYCGQIKLIKTI